MSNLNKGILAMLISAFGFSLMGVFIKLAGDLPTVEKLFFRNAIAAVVSGYFVIKYGLPLWGHAGNRRKLLVRTFFGLVGMLFNFYSIDHMVLSDATMIMQMSPFLVILLSAFILRERVSVEQLLICIIALAGALLIIKPSLDMATIPAWIAFAGAVSAAGAYLMLRVLALSPQKEAFYTIVFFFSFFSCVAILPALILVFEPMNATQFTYLILSGVGATAGQFGITLAYQFAPAKEVSIYSYSSVLYAAGFSILLFNAYPDVYSWIGYLVIFISGIWMYKTNLSH